MNQIHYIIPLIVNTTLLKPDSIYELVIRVGLKGETISLLAKYIHIEGERLRQFKIISSSSPMYKIGESYNALHSYNKLRIIKIKEL